MISQQYAKYLVVLAFALVFALAPSILTGAPTGYETGMPEAQATEISNCANLSANTEYQLTADINATGTCFNITANNVTLDGNGYLINYSQGGGNNQYGVYSIADFTTIKNVRFKEGSDMGGLDYNNYAIYFVGASNGRIQNNTITTFKNSGYGIYLASSSNSNILTNNTITTSEETGIGIMLLSSSNSNITSNTITTSKLSGYGIYLATSPNNIITNNTITTSRNSGYGIYLNSYSNSNILTNNTITTTGSAGAFGIYLTESSSNTLTGMTVNATGTAERMYIESSSNNIFRDITIIGTNNNDTYLRVTSTNNTFLNVTYNISREYVDSDSQLIRKWYYRANVTDTLGAPISGAFVLAYNVSNILIANLTTDATGYTPVGELIEYTNNGGTKSYYSNYLINVTASGYNYTSATRNITTLTNILNDSFTIGICRTLDQPNTIYTLPRNVTAAGTCFTIVANNVTLDGNGYNITYGTGGGAGTNGVICSGYNNLTIKNARIYQSVANGAVSEGIELTSCNNSVIYNNTIWTNGSGSHGISLSGSILANITSNNVSTRYANAINLVTASNNASIISNILETRELVTNGGANGILITLSDFSSILSNNISVVGHSDYGISFTTALYSNLSSNKITTNGSSGYGIYLTVSSNNALTSNTIKTSGADAYGVFLEMNSDSNTIANTIINSTGAGRVFIGGGVAGGSHNIFRDSTLIGATLNDTYLDSTSTNNTFLNVTYNVSREYVASDSQLIRKWYLDVNVTDATGAVQNANVTMWNVTGRQQFSELTAAGGTITTKQLIEYVNNGGTKSYANNYTMNSTKTGYFNNTQQVNFSITNNTRLNIGLSATPATTTTVEGHRPTTTATSPQATVASTTTMTTVTTLSIASSTITTTTAITETTAAEQMPSEGILDVILDLFAEKPKSVVDFIQAGDDKTTADFRAVDLRGIDKMILKCSGESLTVSASELVYVDSVNCSQRIVCRWIKEMQKKNVTEECRLIVINTDGKQTEKAFDIMKIGHPEPTGVTGEKLIFGMRLSRIWPILFLILSALLYAAMRSFRWMIAACKGQKKKKYRGHRYKGYGYRGHRR